MPRPPVKKRKLTQASPPRRGRAKKINLPTPAQTATARRELEQKLAHKPIGDRPIDSDDSDRLVTRRPATTTRRTTQVNDIFVSGGVGKGDIPGSHPRGRRSRPPSQNGQHSSTKPVKPAANSSAPRTSVIDTKSRKSPLRNEVSHVDGEVQPEEVVAPTSGSGSGTIAAIPAESTQTGKVDEVSKLGILKPRKRQPSILLQQLDANDSTLSSLGLDDSLMPADESTPLVPSRGGIKDISPHTLTAQTPPSLKRKYGQQRPSTTPARALLFQPGELASHDDSARLDEPQLPTIPLSALRKSGRKQHAKYMDDEDDILALPRSSSSPAPSPVKTLQKSKSSKNSKHEPITTEQLQSLMPTKRRKTARQRQTRGAIDIAEDSDKSEGAEPLDSNDDSNFEPRKARRKAGARKAALVNSKTTKDKTSLVGKARSVKGAATIKSSTRTTTTPLSRTTRNTVAKSIPQQATVIPMNPLTEETIQAKAKAKEALVSSKRYGGRGRHVNIGNANKENQHGHSSNGSIDDDQISHDLEAEDVIEIAPSVSPAKPKYSTKWQEIDNWEMEFEQVEVMTPSDENDMRR